MRSHQTQGARRQMIREIDISNYKCFENERLQNLGRINVLVGQNASGKTALLEAIFLAAGWSPEVAQRIRQWRGGEMVLHATSSELDRGMWRDLFHMFDTSKKIKIELSGTSEHSRTVEIDYDDAKTFVPAREQGLGSIVFQSPIGFTYARPGSEPSRVTATFMGSGYQFSGMSEAPIEASFFAANHNYSSQENVDRFSKADLAGRGPDAVQAIANEFGFIRDLSILSAGGASTLYAESPWFKTKVPLSVISTGVNKFVTLVLAIASTPNGLIMIDEIENGFHHTRLKSIWTALIGLAREHNVQIFASTHSWECLQGLRDAVKDNVEDVTFTRMNGAENGVSIEQFRGDTILKAIERDREVRS